MTDSDTPTPKGAAPGPSPSPAEIEALRAENAALRTQIEQDTPHRSGSGFRRFSAWVLAILAILLTVFAVTVGWAKTTLLDTDTFVATLSPLSRDAAVAEALSIQIGDAVVEATNLEASISDALPPEIAFIAGPVAEGAGSLMEAAAKSIIQTDVFASVWSQALRTTHASVTVLVSGNGAVVAEEGTIAIDLDTIAAPALEAVADKGLDVEALVGEEFTLGRIVLIESDALGAAQSAVHLLNTLGWLTVVLALLAIAGAMLVAVDRRRMISILGFGAAIGGVLELVLARFGRGMTVGAVEDIVYRAAGLAVWDAVLRNLQSALWALVLLGLVIGFVAWIIGPSPRAGRLRATSSDGISRWRGDDQEPPTGAALFFYKWRRPLEWGVVGLGLLILLFAPMITFTLVLVVIILGGIAIGVIEMIAGPVMIAAPPVIVEETIVVVEDEQDPVDAG